eukprot:CAMPEP_0204303602 /NCGR_PEP_ID=MMETSP0468-20130131/83991_1 /ASSEMBLY_ACC=CAM_ASM_000383 /TAXON_ID=2969 /ORGANISM="Oxyrrhis marina" /LENGTH=609 /DNA_ID=CAMNT_0051282917 /DNA_START=49 /DNA_END=1876 /DNA_ORIENTATION=-
MRTCASLFAVSHAAVAHRNPVSKVVDLLRDMQAKIEADGKAESKVYDKYACWCATTTQRKTDQITDHKSSIASLSNEILELKAVIATRVNDIAKLDADIADNAESMEQATTLRENENKAFQAETAEMQSAIGSLEKAIKVLSGAGTGGAALVEVAAAVERIAPKTKSSGALLQQVAKLRYSPQSASVQGILKDMYDTFVVNLETMNAEEAAVLAESASVQGILKDMYDTFVVNLETMNAEEASSQHQYEDLMETKTAQNKDWMVSRSRKEEEKAAAEDTLGMDTENREGELEELEAAQRFFADTAAACKDKADEWAERSRNRDEELTGIQQAIDILDSPDARKLFTSATATFVQVSDTQTSALEPVYAALQKAAKSSHSPRLALLTVQLRQGARGHFDEVVKVIDDMLATLKEEDATDIENRDNCVEQENDNHNRLQDLDYAIKKLGNKISKLNSKKDRLEEEIGGTQDAISNQEQVMADAMVQRNADHDDFVQAKADDEAAIALIKQATEVLTRFYKNNKIAALQAPEFAISEDQAPDAKFNDAGSHNQEKRGIVKILEQIRENMEADVSDGEKTEASELAAYEQQRADDRNMVESLKNHLADLQAEK